MCSMKNRIIEADIPIGEACKLTIMTKVVDGISITLEQYYMSSHCILSLPSKSL